MTRWEYNTVVFPTSFWVAAGKLDGQMFQDKLDEHGRDGWELVSVFDTNRQEGATFQVVAVFKRPID